MASGLHTFASLAEHFARMQYTALSRNESLLERIGKLVKTTAKSLLGHSHGPLGPFPEWAPLSPSTITGRERAGYVPITPLLASGQLRDDIGYSVSMRTATAGVVTIGSTLDYAAHLELGTSKMPPRSFLGRALHMRVPMIVRMVGESQVFSMTMLAQTGAPGVPVLFGGRIVEHSVTFNEEE